MVEVINAEESKKWHESLAHFSRVDVCHLPEYHKTYSLRVPESEALLWNYEKEGERLSYPFLLSPVVLTGPNGEGEPTNYFDISGIYGYSGPLSTTDDATFLDEAWGAFDLWAKEHRLIAEFIRFSVYVDNKKWAHKNCEVEMNRPVSLALLPECSDTYMKELSSKTRNMIRKAYKSDLVAKEVDFAQGLSEFRALYEETMGRNQATGFFMYDDAYYNNLMSLPDGGLRLFAVYQGSRMVAASMGIIHKDMALYHLGASLREASRLGAGNLVLFEMAKGLIDQGVKYLNVGGGRTTTQDDPLFKFKRSNGTSDGEFFIGKRVIQPDAYDSVAKRWQVLYNSELKSPKLQFYR